LQNESSVNCHPLSSIDINVRDLNRSADFYSSLLDLPRLDIPESSAGQRRAVLAAGPLVLRLAEIGESGRGNNWTTDDLQKGFRHVGFKVDDVDAWAERVRAAGVRFHLEPLNAVGGVRITFFQDPDEMMLELVQGSIEYHKVWNDELLAAERRLPVPHRPRFDHVAITVENLDRTIEFYRKSLGFGVVGQLFLHQDPRGFVITYLKAGDTVLEVFSYQAPKSPSPWQADDHQLGFRTAGFEAEDLAATSGVLAAAGATVVGPAPRLGLGRQFTDPDGFPLTIAGQR